MAQIIINVSKRASPFAPAKMDLEYRLRPNENTATKNLVREVMLSLAQSWNLGDIKVPPDEARIERIVRVAGRKIEEAANA